MYALGCILYQAIAGKPPFERDTDVAKIFAHLSDPPPTLSAARPEVPDALDVVVSTALAKAPEERHASAGDLAAAARHAIGAAPPAAVRHPRPTAPTVAAPKKPPTVAPPPATPPTAPARPPAERRGPRLLLPGIALAVLAIGVTLALVLSGGGDEGSGGGNGGSPTGGGGETAVIPAGNLTENPSFESDTDGWTFNESSIATEQAADAPDGENVVRVTQTDSAENYSIDDSPDTVSASRAGTLYTASAWVKATDATDGAPICISIRERPEGDVESFPFSSASVTASANEYREVRVTHRAEESGMRIGVHVFRVGGGSGEGEEFLVDAIALREGGDAASAGEGDC